MDSLQQLVEYVLYYMWLLASSAAKLISCVAANKLLPFMQQLCNHEEAAWHELPSSCYDVCSSQVDTLFLVFAVALLLAACYTYSSKLTGKFFEAVKEIWDAAIGEILIEVWRVAKWIAVSLFTLQLVLWHILLPFIVHLDKAKLCTSCVTTAPPAD